MELPGAAVSRALLEEENRMRKTILIILGLLLVSGSMLAQGTTAAITGTVTSDGKPLGGVTVTVSSPSLQGTRPTVAGANGVYNFSALPPGDYTVAFELQGLQREGPAARRRPCSRPEEERRSYRPRWLQPPWASCPGERERTRSP